ncbi:MAG: type II CRISPR-associated endonuclease Cas1 [Elusimicrobiota bacterium]
MSYHIIHILTHNSYLSVDRGFLVLKSEEGEKRAPLNDILAVIVAARGISFSGESLNHLINNKAVIIHCDENYRPIGKTSGFSGIVHSQIFEKQIQKDEKFSSSLWQKIIKAKIENQAKVLDKLNVTHNLYEILKSNNIDEGNCARHYWKKYFSKFGHKKPKEREKKGAEHPVNQMLNYAYAVMGAFCHREIIAHGLNPLLGIHHKYRFKSEPLLYDLMEPLRPFCDLILFEFKKNNPKKDIREFIKVVAEKFTSLLFKYNGKKLKMPKIIDRYVSSVADCFYSAFPGALYIPKIDHIYEEK